MDGKDIAHWNQREFAKRVAYLPQHLPAATNLTACELIGMGRYAWNGLFGRQTAADKQAIAEALRLTHTEKNSPINWWIRCPAANARAFGSPLLAQQSRFLLLDEPLAALDIAHQVEVMQLVHQLSRDLGLGVVIVIHDINLAAHFFAIIWWRCTAANCWRRATHSKSSTRRC